MSLLTMSAQLAEGFLITVEIFVLTLLFSLPLGGNSASKPTVNVLSDPLEPQPVRTPAAMLIASNATNTLFIIHPPVLPLTVGRVVYFSMVNC